MTMNSTQRCIASTAFLIFFFFRCPIGEAKKLKAPVVVTNEYLQPKAIEKLKKQNCTFFHVWATWCSICMEEMPDLVKLLKTEKGIKPVLIDVSSLQVQESFSKKWLQSLRPGFTTYLKPNVKDQEYLSAIDKNWSGALPFSALYHRGKLLKTWTGTTELKTLGAQFQNLCVER